MSGHITGPARGRLVASLGLYGGCGRGYGTDVGESPVAAAGGVYGFPAVLSSFIGRDEPLREIVGLLGEHRLVTVTGPGGSGKTRLAGEVARRAAGGFADGAWLVGLAPVRDPAQVAAAVAAALGVREQPGIPAAEAVARVLARQQFLLVLDNCEHVIDEAAQLCAGLLMACDDVRVLVTSREPLRIAGEARYRLGPLTLPRLGEADSGSEAVTLFVDRARCADPRFTLDEQAADLAARLVTRLDGMPLAIELAAARVEALGLAQLLDRLEDRFELLAGGDRLAPSRQRSLAATVEWSYQLLGEEEQRVFRALSVFPGSFTLAAAEAVSGEGAGPAVLRLVDCSLLPPPQTGPDGRARYGMLETLRAYGARLLAGAAEQDAAAAALAGFAAAVAGEAGPGLRSRAEEAGAMRLLDAEDATMRQALGWAMEHDLAVARRLADVLGWWWYSRGRLAGQYPMLREAAGGAVPGSGWWCAAQFWAGWAAVFSGDRTGALSHFNALRDAMTGRPPGTALADGLIGRSAVLRNTGLVAEAAEDARQAASLAREIGYPAGEAQALAELSLAASIQGDHRGAVHLAGQAEQATAGIPGVMARTVCSYAQADVLIEAGELSGARRVCADGLAWSRDAGDLGTEAGLLPMMALLETEAGHLRDAAAHLHAALQMVMRAGHRGELLNILDYCGYLCATAGRPAEAVTVWAALDAIVRPEGIERWSATGVRRQDPLRAARQALGPARARAAEARGGAMNLDTAAEYALLLTGPSTQEPRAPRSGELSARERELVTLVAAGRTNAQIAAELFISVRTVSSHLDRIRDKTGCRRRADLTRLALSEGLV